MQGSALEGKIASNYRLEQLITQAGEAALLEAERQIEGLDVAAIATDNCVNGYCTSRKTDANYVTSIGTACNNAAHLEERWALPNTCTGNLDVWNTTGRSIEYTSSNLAQTSSVKARYIIEYLGLVPIVTSASGTPAPHTSHADCAGTPVTPCPEMFRITTLASDLSDRGRVMLQTTYQK